MDFSKFVALALQKITNLAQKDSVAAAGFMEKLSNKIKEHKNNRLLNDGIKAEQTKGLPGIQKIDQGLDVSVTPVVEDVALYKKAIDRQDKGLVSTLHNSQSVNNLSNKLNNINQGLNNGDYDNSFMGYDSRKLAIDTRDKTSDQKQNAVNRVGDIYYDNNPLGGFISMEVNKKTAKNKSTQAKLPGKGYQVNDMLEPLYK